MAGLSPLARRWRRYTGIGKIGPGYAINDQFVGSKPKFRSGMKPWHVQNGTPMAMLQVFGGWRSMTMLMRYAHLPPAHRLRTRAMPDWQNGTKPCTRHNVAEAERPA